jgi:hypothetical protein
MEHYRREASQRGLSLAEYLAQVLAEAHGLDIPSTERESDQHHLAIGA